VTCQNIAITTINRGKAGIVPVFRVRALALTLLGFNAGCTFIIYI
jgi:hypothetical protein